MSKRERKFLENMTADLLRLHLRGEITELTLKVAQGSVSYSDSKRAGSPTAPDQPA